jgi:hypothetical protein
MTIDSVRQRSMSCVTVEPRKTSRVQNYCRAGAAGRHTCNGGNLDIEFEFLPDGYQCDDWERR